MAVPLPSALLLPSPPSSVASLPDRSSSERESDFEEYDDDDDDGVAGPPSIVVPEPQPLDDAMDMGKKTIAPPAGFL